MAIDRRTFALAGAGLALGCASTPAPAPAGWRALPTEPYRGKQDDIAFVSPDVGWYGNGEGKLYRTRDGGESWVKVWEQPGTFIRALGFLDAANGFLGNVGVNYFPNVTDTQPLYRTRDGGVTWTPIEADGMNSVAGICGIDIVHDNHLTLIHAAGRVGGPAMVLRSMDRGESWRVIDLRSQAGMILDVKFFDAMRGLVCASSSEDMAQGTALILRTEDGGETWSRAYQSERRFENCWKMSFPTREIGYATVQNYEEGRSQRVIIKTVDGGRSWRELPLIDDATAREFGIGFVTPDRGWVGTTSTGYETHDGGQSWAPVEMGRAVNKIRIIRDRRGAAVRAYAIGTDVWRLDV